MNILEKINNLNIILVALASIATILPFFIKKEEYIKARKILFISSGLIFLFLYIFNFEKIIFYISLMDTYSNYTLINGTKIGYFSMSIHTVIFFTFFIMMYLHIIKNHNTILITPKILILVMKEINKKIASSFIFNFVMFGYVIYLLYFTLDFYMKNDLTNKLFNYEYKEYLLKNVNPKNEDDLKVLNKILDLTDRDSIKQKDLEISIKTFALLSEYYKNQKDREKTLIYLKDSSEVIIKLINNKVEYKINPPYYYLDESSSIDKSIIQKNREAVILFKNQNYQEAKKIFIECLESFKNFSSEVDFSNFAKLNINLANTLFELREFENAINNLSLALTSAYNSLYIENRYIYNLYDRKLNAQIELNLDTNMTMKRMRDFINAIEMGIIKKERIEKISLEKEDKKIKTKESKVILVDENREALFENQLNFANTLYKAGDYENAIYFYNSALKSMPKKNHYFLIYIYHKMGLTYQRLNQIDKSIQSFEFAKSYALELGYKYHFPDESINITYSEN